VSQAKAMLHSCLIEFTKLCALALVLVVASPATLGGANPADSPSELELKAAFVLNFVRLVKWDSVSGEADNTELVVCALGNSDFANAVRHVAAGKVVGTRSISVRLNPNPDASHCRVLIVDAAQYPITRQALNGIRDAPVLTIGNGAGLIQMGGMFELIVEDHKVQFDASLEAVRRAGLDVSARLLQLSRNLRKGANGGS
jgi:hypothetical protein